MVIVHGRLNNLKRRSSNMLVPSQLVSGPTVNKLFSSSENTNGTGSALQIIPKRTYRTIRVEINSIDRDYLKYPLSSNFSWDFPFPVKEIKEVRLIGGTVPIPYLNVDSFWNKFTFTEGTVTNTITIPIGYYTITTLLVVIQSLLNNTGVGNIYSLTQEQYTGRIIITATSGTNDFSILFASGSFTDIIDKKTNTFLEIRCPARMMGFGWADYKSSNGKITAARAPNIWYCLEKSYLYLNFDSSQDLRSVFRGSGRKEPSAIIYNNEINKYNYFIGIPIPMTKYLNKETFDTNIVPAPSSLSRIRTLNISLRDMFYNLINTQGREISLLLELVVAD